MIIKNSQVTMSSQSSYFEYSETHQASLVERAGSQINLDLSEGTKGITSQIKEHEKEKERKAKEQERENQKQLVLNFKNQLVKDKERTTGSNNADNLITSKEDFQSRLIRLLFEAINRSIHGKDAHKKSLPTDFDNSTKNIFSLSKGNSLTDATGGASSQIINNEGYNPSAISKMVLTNINYGFQSVSQYTSFEGKGQVQTADGRSLDFNISLSLSESFTHEYASIASKSYFMCDPLIINMDSNVAHISDQKFLFDLDCDGFMDNISFTDKQSGFLALDKNDDGVINDGSELFGTQSGDGFKDLARYDSDHNGWIDEADDIFKRLKVWTKDENGNDKLINLKEADVGAIYLGSTNTSFTLYNHNNYSANGQLQKTGIFLKESGGAGTIQHIDLAL